MRKYQGQPQWCDGHSDSRSGVTCGGHETSSRVGGSDWATVVCIDNATSSRLSGGHVGAVVLR
jgi:hypothetical protein